MDELISADNVWREVDYDAAWTPFNERFNFAANYHDRDNPAIRLDPSCLVIDLAAIFEHNGPRYAAGQDAINAVALRAFVWLAGEEDMIALDWQHPSYRYSPATQAVSSALTGIPVFPDGDYYAHMHTDLRWGTFGHPWQQTLTIWGDELVSALGAELLTWLPRHPQSLA